jgi:hypothetical protein
VRSPFVIPEKVEQANLLRPGLWVRVKEEESPAYQRFGKLSEPVREVCGFVAEWLVVLEGEPNTPYPFWWSELELLPGFYDGRLSGRAEGAEHG